MLLRYTRAAAFAVLIGGTLLVGHALAHEPSPLTGKAPAFGRDYMLQGEYTGTAGESTKLGCQVIALGKGRFQAVVYPGGLPGDGWDGKHKSLLDGTLKESVIVFQPAKGKRKYLAKSADEFSATSKFPPEGQQAYQGAADGKALTLTFADERTMQLAKVQRKSPTLGKKPPEGAIVLFDGTNKKEWQGGRLDDEILHTDGKDILTKRKFNDYTMHVEFLLPFRPEARGQGRGNSGFYQVDHYEVQILDSFGLEGKNNECGGIYSKTAPKLNMCFPPLTWQTYDVEFTNARTDDRGQVVKPARITVKLNGVVVHEDLDIKGKTGGSRPDAVGTPGPIKLQGHGNPLEFRNIWILERP